MKKKRKKKHKQENNNRLDRVHAKVGYTDAHTLHYIRVIRA